MAALFVEDISIKRLLYGITIRSPVSKGRLKGFELPQFSGAYTFVTAKDIPGRNELEDAPEDSGGGAGRIPVSVLAAGSVSYIGQPVALLFGPDEAKLREYAAGIKVLTEEEKGSFGFRDDAELFEERSFGPPPNDPEQAFAGASALVSGIYRTGIQEHNYSEPTGAAAVYKKSDHPEHEEAEPSSKNGKEKSLPLHIYTATQWPFHVRACVAKVLGIGREKVVVESTSAGIHMDGKVWYPSLVACHAALGCFISKKPVKLILATEADFRYSPKRFASQISMKTALDENGQVLGTQIETQINLGAECLFTTELLDHAALGSFGAYRFANTSLRAKALRSNIPPQGPCTGFGMAQGFFAVERQVSRIADSLRQDPAEWRKDHVLGKNEALAIGAPLKDTVSAGELIDTAAAISGYYRKWASYELLRRSRPAGWTENTEPLRGIGIALAYQGCGFLYSGRDRGTYEVELTMEKDGSLEIRTSMAGPSGDTASVWGKIAGELLSIDMDKVQVRALNTALAPDSGPASLSRDILVLSKLVERCCTRIRKQRFRDPLPITVRQGVKPVKSPAWDASTGLFYDANTLSRLGWGAAVVEVEVDLLEYTPRIRGVWLAVDGGRVLSERHARYALKLQTIQALGWAGCENLEYIDGAISLDKFIDYEIPRVEDIPPINIDFMWSDSANPRGIGELPACCVPAAFVQAVSQAVDHPFEKIPLLPPDIWEAVKQKTEEAPA